MNKYDLIYVSTLTAISDTLQIFYENKSIFGYNYLKNKCQQTTRLTHLILPDLKEQSGKLFEQKHCWNYDPQNNIIIDLSAWQFGNNISPNKFVFDKNYTHYQEYKFNEKNLEDYKNNIKTNNHELEELLKIYNQIKSGY